jgi:predicted branched-subunit amino acid permease
MSATVDRLALHPVGGLTDETFAAMEDRYRRLGVHRNSHWAYLASIVAMHVNWNCWTLIGIAVGSQMSGLDGLGLEFAAIATFIGMVVQKLRTPGAQVAARGRRHPRRLLAALPYKAGLTIATLVAIAVA